jgi:hypothetical protein
MLKFKDIELSDHTFTRKYNGVRYTYEIPNLIQYAKEQGYKSFDLPIEGIDMSSIMWHIDNMRDFAYHMSRINKADFKHPVLIDSYGTICDGWHRVIKAVMLGHKTIKAIRMQDMPIASSTEEVE